MEPAKTKATAQEPLPGPNAFKYNGKTVAMYPRYEKTRPCWAMHLARDLVHLRSGTNSLQCMLGILAALGPWNTDDWLVRLQEDQIRS